MNICILQGTLIEVYEWVKGINIGNIDDLLALKTDIRTQSNMYELDEFRFWKGIGRNWFINRVVNEWNKLSSYVVKANMVERFKWWLDNLWMRKADGKHNSQELPYVGCLASCSLLLS